MPHKKYASYVIKNTEDQDEYKYFGILEAEGFNNLKIKEKVRK